MFGGLRGVPKAMHSVRIVPNKRWQLVFRRCYMPTPGPGNGQKLCGIAVHGIPRGRPLPNGATAQDNIEFSARIQYVWAGRGCSSAHVTFRDNDPAAPYSYVMAGSELGEFFKGVHAGLIPMHPDGFDVRLTFIKKGTQVFAKPLL